MIRFQIAVHQEFTTVSDYIVGKCIGGRDWRTPMELEQWRELGGGESVFRAYRNCRQDASGRKIEDLFAISAPARFSAAASRNLPLARRVGECCDINFPLTGFIGGVSQPFAVLGNLSVGLVPFPGKFGPPAIGTLH